MAAEEVVSALDNQTGDRLDKIEATLARLESSLSYVCATVEGLGMRLHQLQCTMWCPWAPVQVPAQQPRREENVHQEHMQTEDEKVLKVEHVDESTPCHEATGSSEDTCDYKGSDVNNVNDLVTAHDKDMAKKERVRGSPQLFFIGQQGEEGRGEDQRGTGCAAGTPRGAGTSGGRAGTSGGGGGGEER